MRQSTRQATAIPPPATEPFTAGPAPGAGSSVSAAPTPQALQGGGGAYGGVPSMSSIAMGGQGYAPGARDAYGRPIASPSSSSSQYRGRSYDEHERRPASRSR